MRLLGQFGVGRGEGGNFGLHVRRNWAIAEIREVEAAKINNFEAIRAIGRKQRRGRNFGFVCPKQLGLAVSSGSQYPSYRFYERHLRGFDPFDGPMCIESTCASDSAV